jgi:hypothetical protein
MSENETLRAENLRLRSINADLHTTLEALIGAIDEWPTDRRWNSRYVNRVTVAIERGHAAMKRAEATA